MDVFQLRDRLVEDYKTYTWSFIKIRDPAIKRFVQSELDGDGFWPEPLLQLNPTFYPGGTVDELVSQGVLHEECKQIFRIGKSDSDHIGRELPLHKHQREAILTANEGKSFVLTSGTGSGKSLTYIIPIVDYVLRKGSGGSIKAIIVYPMNALANSQEEELKKFLESGYPDGKSPVSFARFTGQERGDDREAIKRNPPDILLTNYMMLELLLTRSEDRELVNAAQGLQFLVFDELHTYRGRQGADVALLIRRCREAFGRKDITCIGTSATLSSDGSNKDQQHEVARVAEMFFGTSFSSDQVIGETLERATPEADFTNGDTVKALRTSIQENEEPPADYDSFQSHPLASWIESTFGIQSESGSDKLVRQQPRRLEGGHIGGQRSASEELAELTDAPVEDCATILRRWLMSGSEARKDEYSRFPHFRIPLASVLYPRRYRLDIARNRDTPTPGND